MEDPENQVLDVIELLLTAHIYNDNDQLDENDLPPHIRKNYWNSKERRVDSNAPQEWTVLSSCQKPPLTESTRSRTDGV